MGTEKDWASLVKTAMKMDDAALANLKTQLGGGVFAQPFYASGGENSRFYKAPHLEPYKHITSADPKVWTDEFQAYPGATVEVLSLESMENLCSQASRVFLKGTEWRKKKTLEPWLKSHAEGLEVHFGWDPWTVGLHQGQVSRWDDGDYPLQELTQREGARYKAFCLSSEIYSLAGANGVQELAILLASAVETCRYFEERLPLDQLLSHFTFELVGEADPIWTAAKIQALKTLWVRILEIFSQESVGVPEVYLCPNVRQFATREPTNNLIRLSLMQAGGFFGGAHGFRHYPFDVFSKTSKEAGRLSRNIGLILQSEAGLGYVQNPLEGSGAYEDWVQQLSRQAWEAFQEIDKKGGLISAMQSGWLQGEIQKSHDLDQRRIHCGEKANIGVNQFVGLEVLNSQFPFLDRKNSLRIEDWWESRMGTPKMSKCSRVKPITPAQPLRGFEDFQMECDKWTLAQGQRPYVFAFCEKPAKQKNKIANLRKKLAVAGFNLKVSNKIEKTDTDFACCLGSDPDAEYWASSIEALRACDYRNLVWVGERKHPLLEAHWGPSQSLLDICKHVHEDAGGRR